MDNLYRLRTSHALRLLPRVITLFLLAHQSLAMPTLLQTRNIATNESITSSKFEDGWVSGPKNRGTLTLIFSCVITLFLCVWTTVQVNIEPENNTNTTLSRLIGVELDTPQHRVAWVKRLQQFLAKRWVRKLGWSALTLIVPEAMLAVAMYERRAAIRLNNAMVKIMPPMEVAGTGSESKKKQDRWNIVLSYYTIMGGFCIPDNNHIQDSTSQPSTQEDTDEQATPAASKDEAIEAAPFKQASHHVRHEARSTNDNGRFTLTPQGILLVAKKNMLPNIKPEDVLDKSKANKLTKLIVFFQALWMLQQVISRTALGLPVTLLELHTCVHTFCALVTYATWWDKPVDVNLATLVPVDSDTLNELINEQQSKDEDGAALSPFSQSDEPQRYLTSRAGLGKILFIDLVGDARKDLGLKQGYFDMLIRGYGRVRRGWRSLWREAWALSFVGLVYGLLHLAVWQNEFPTKAEQVLWRVASVTAAVAWIGFLFLLAVGGRKLNWYFAMVFGLGEFPCLFVRFFLLFESFYSIRKLPSRSYELPVWSGDWPGIA